MSRFRTLSFSLGLTLAALGAATSGCAATPDDDVVSTEANLERTVTDLPWGDADAAATPDGKLVVVDTRHTFLHVRDVLVKRFNADGSVDPTFTPPSPEAFQRLLNTSRGAEGARIAVSPNGSVVLALTYHHPGDADPRLREFVALIRLNPDGSLDTSFGEGGMSYRDSQGRRIEGVAPWIRSDASGNILTAGTVGNTVQLARYRASDGKLDPSFGQQGLVRVSAWGNSGFEILPFGFGEQPDGRIVVLVTLVHSNGTPERFLLRLDTNGHADPTFGVDGRRPISIGNKEFLGSMMVRADGRIVVGSSLLTNVSTPTERQKGVFIVRQFRADGAPDTSFGSAGRQTLAPDDLPTPCPHIRVNNFAEDASGRLIGVGPWSTTNFAFRLLADGALDASFGTTGFFELEGSRINCGGTLPLVTPVVFGNDVRFVAGSWPAQAIEIVSP